MSTNQSEQTATKKQSRKNHKQAKRQEKQAAKRTRQTSAEPTSEKGNRKQQKMKRKEEKKQANMTKSRLLPIWLRIIIVLFLSAIALVIGLMVGYGFIGDGTPIDALKKETWQHIIDIVNKK